MTHKKIIIGKKMIPYILSTLEYIEKNNNNKNVTKKDQQSYKKQKIISFF